MRPHAVRLAKPVRSIQPLSDGTLAALAGDEVTFLDADLHPLASSALPHPVDRLVELPDGRLLGSTRGAGWLAVGRRGEPFAVVGEQQMSSSAATAEGFLVRHRDELFAERDGALTPVELDLRTTIDLVPWDGRVVAATADELVVLDASGAVVLRTPLEVTSEPVVAGDTLIVPTVEDLRVLDAALGEVARLPFDRAPAAWGRGVVLRDRDAAVYRDAERTWRWPAPIDGRWLVAGDWLVVGSWSLPNAWILDRNGALRGELVLHDGVSHACAFGDGIALLDGSHEVVWWRPDQAPVRLAHDFTPRSLTARGDELIALEGDVVYRWAPDRDGPEAPAAATGAPPLGVPLIADGGLVTLHAIGRYAARGVDAEGRPVRVNNDAPWRSVIGRDQAMTVINELLQRKVDSELPPLTGGVRVLAQAAPEIHAGLHARGLFAPTSLTPEERQIERDLRKTTLAELGHAVGFSRRTLQAAIRARRFPLEPPRRMPGHDYLGSFTTTGDLVVSDPCYLGKRAPRAGVSLSVRLAAHDGVWHVYVRLGVGRDVGRIAELIAVHSDGFPLYANERAGAIGVDSGCVGVFDRACPRPDDEQRLEEGIFAGRAAIASSGYGDGGYPVYVGSTQRKVAKVRVHYLGPTQPEVDASMAAAPATGGIRKYSAKERFAVGEQLEHVSFGVGTVVRLDTAGKIEVMFGDARRVLIHGRG